jgi:hypothetical protein
MIHAQIATAAADAVTRAAGMSPAAWGFLLAAWGAVLALNFFAFHRILTRRRHFDPDGLGPARPPSPGADA